MRDTTKVICELDFSLNGNARTHLVDGWNEAEADFTWSQGFEAKLRLPSAHPGMDLLVVLWGEPYVTAEHTHQSVLVKVNGIQIAKFRPGRSFTHCFRYSSPEQSRDGTELQFLFPDARRPSADGLDDNRVLAIALRGMKAFEAKPAYQPNILSHFEDAEYSRLADIVRKTPALQWRGTPENSGLTMSDLFRELLFRVERKDTRVEVVAQYVTQFMLVRAWKQAEALISAMLDIPKGSITLTAFNSPDVSLVRWTVLGSKCHRFEIGVSCCDSIDDTQTCRLVVIRWLCILPVLLLYSETERTFGTVIINVGDEPHARGLAFCGSRRDEVFLLPDPEFLRSFAYDKMKTSLGKISVSYADRKPVALWRGSPTGRRDANGVLGLSRIQLCCLGKDAAHAPYLDAGLTNIAQLSSEDVAVVEQLDITRPFIPATRYHEWMFLIDVDGNTSSWSGLFEKLLSGSVVLKVDSRPGWRQWYYDRLIPFENFVPVSHDFSDLLAKIKYLTYNRSASERIGQAGRELALSMTYGSEVTRVFDDIESAMFYHLRLEDQ